MSSFNNDSNSDSFDMFTDDEEGDMDWHRASVDVYTLPSDTTTMAATYSKHIQQQSNPTSFHNMPPAPNEAQRDAILKQMHKQSMSMADISKQANNIKAPSPKNNTDRIAMMKQMQQQSMSMADISSHLSKKTKKKGKKGHKKDKKSKKKGQTLSPKPSPPPKKKKTKREKAIEELIVTEVHYVSRLYKLIMIWANKLENKDKLITAIDFKIIFPPSLKTIANLNGELLKDLQQRNSICNDDKQLIISDIILGFAPYLKMYQLYINNSNSRLRTVSKCLDNAKFYTFHQKCRQHFDNLTLIDLIILPVQRIPRYKLLIHEIITNTNKKHPDFKGLNEALDIISKINIENNEKLKDLDARMKVLNVTNEIQKAPNLASAARIFVFSGELYKIKLNGKTERHIFYVFNDCIVYAVPSKIGKKCIFKMRLPIDAAFAVQQIKDMSKYTNVFAMYSSLESFLVTTKSDGELKDKWMEILTKLINESRHSHYFHATSNKARIGRGEVLISQAPLEIPKNIKKTLNKELATMHMEQTLGSKTKKRKRFVTKDQMELLVEKEKMQVIPNDIIPEMKARYSQSGRMRSKDDVGMMGYSTDNKLSDHDMDELSDDEKEFFKPKRCSSIWVQHLNVSQSVRVSPKTVSQSHTNAPKGINTTDTKRRRSSWGECHTPNTPDTVRCIGHKPSRSNPETLITESETLTHDSFGAKLEQIIPQNHGQRSAMMKQMNQQSVSVSCLVKSKKSTPPRRVKRRNKPKESPKTDEINTCDITPKEKQTIKPSQMHHQSMSVSSQSTHPRRVKRRNKQNQTPKPLPDADTDSTYTTPIQKQTKKAPENNVQMQKQSESMQRITTLPSDARTSAAYTKHIQQQPNPTSFHKIPPPVTAAMLKQMRQQSMSMANIPKQLIKTPSPKNDTDRIVIMKQMQKQSMSMANISSTANNIKPKVNTSWSPKAKPLGMQSKEKESGVSNLVPRFNTEDRFANNTKEAVHIDKIGPSKQNVAYLTDRDSKVIWNAYIDEHGVAAPTEWALHKFIKANPDLPTKTFRQARGIYRAFKLSGRV